MHGATIRFIICTVFRDGMIAMAISAMEAALSTVNNLIAIFNINNRNIT